LFYIDSFIIEDDLSWKNYGDVELLQGSLTNAAVINKQIINQMIYIVAWKRNRGDLIGSCTVQMESSAGYRQTWQENIVAYTRQKKLLHADSGQCEE
jgi:hypothetical protein